MDKRRKELVIPLVIAIARKDLGIRIHASDISWADREEGGRKAAILVK